MKPSLNQDTQVLHFISEPNKNQIIPTVLEE